MVHVRSEVDLSICWSALRYRSPLKLQTLLYYRVPLSSHSSSPAMMLTFYVRYCLHPCRMINSLCVVQDRTRADDAGYW